MSRGEGGMRGFCGLELLQGTDPMGGVGGGRTCALDPLLREGGNLGCAVVGLGSGDKDTLSHLLVCHHEPWPPSLVCVCFGVSSPVYLGSPRILVI